MGITKFLILCVVVVMLQTTVIAYTEQNGVSEGDTVNLDYELKVDGNQIDKGNIPTAKISADGGFIEGFWKAIIGMKLNVYKTFVVPPEQGYTDPSNQFYGKSLEFAVFVNNIVDSVDPTTSSQTQKSSTVPGLALDINLFAVLFCVLMLSSVKLTKYKLK